MNNDNMREKLLAAFEAHQKRMAQGMIGAGDGDRVRGYLERHVNLSDFEAGWQASREALVIQVPDLRLCCEDFGVEFIKNIEAAGVKVKP